jgi:hypothetical protein
MRCPISLTLAKFIVTVISDCLIRNFIRAARFFLLRWTTYNSWSSPLKHFVPLYLFVSEMTHFSQMVIPNLLEEFYTVKFWVPSMGAWNVDGSTIQYSTCWQQRV